MMKPTKALAEQIARDNPGLSEWDQARDTCDTSTSGELDAVQLDLLTEWVLAANKAREKA